MQIARNWSNGYIPFAVRESAEEASDVCDAMRRLQNPVGKGHPFLRQTE